MSTTIPTGSASQQAAAMLSQQTTPVTENKAAPKGVAKAEASPASGAAIGAGDRVEISAEAWNRFKQESASRVLDLNEEFRRTGDKAAFNDGLRQLAIERDEFKAIHGEVPKDARQIQLEKYKAESERYAREVQIMSEQIRALAREDAKRAEAMPDYAVIKDQNGKALGRIRQDGSIIIDKNESVGRFGGLAGLQRIALQTEHAENPAEARFQTLALTFGGLGSIERTGIAYRPFDARNGAKIDELMNELGLIQQRYFERWQAIA